MKRIISTFVFACILLWPGYSQLIETDPAVVTTGQRILLYFNTSQETGPLKNYTDDLYTHTGVILEGSSSWQHVIGTWGVNSSQPKLQYIGNYKYLLDITPTIEAFYSIGQGEKVMKMAFVFRNATSDKQTADLFVEVSEPGLNVVITSPTEFTKVLEFNGTLNVRADATAADSLSLFIDNQYIKKSSDPTFLTHFILADSYGGKWVKAVAYDLPEIAADSFYYFVRTDPVVEDLPTGIRDGVNYTSATTATLVLHAPNKSNVFLLGDPLGWIPNDAGFMKKTSDGSRFWLELNNLTPQKEYRYQFLVEGSLKIADPYTDKVLDPSNDQYITEGTYPDLIAYPYDSTTGIISVMQTDQDTYNWTSTNFQPPEKTELVIYELLMRDFTDSHNYKTVMDTLWYLDSLGINAIELMPINEFEGNLSWGYNPSFYFAPDKYYGPKNDLKVFVDSCHGRGIAVIMDIVLNHAENQSPLVQLYFDGSKPTIDNPWFNVDHNFENPDAHWGNDFNHESVHTQALVDSINSYWMSEYKIDGFRFDFTKGFGNNIKSNTTDPWGSNYDADRIRLLKRMADAIWDRNPNAYVILEHLSENTEERELALYGMLLWGNMSGMYSEAAMGYQSDLSGASYKSRGWGIPHLVSYAESHDEERIMFKTLQYGNAANGYFTTDFWVAINRMKLAAVFHLMIPGPKMIWQFGELGYDYSINYGGPDFDPSNSSTFCRLCSKPTVWTYFTEELRKELFLVYHFLNQLRHNHDVFQTSDYSYALADMQKRIHLNHADMNVTILGNFDVILANMNPSFQETGRWYEYFSGDSIDVSSSTDPITLDPGEYRIYTTKRLKEPDFVLSAPGNIQSKPRVQIHVYPNPSTAEFTIQMTTDSQEELSIEILDISGRIVRTLVSDVPVSGYYQITWEGNTENGVQAAPGFYLIVVHSKTSQEVIKILKQ